MTCHLYLIVADVASLPIRDHGFGDKIPFKVGIASDLERRLTVLQIGCPFALSIHRAWVLPNRKMAAAIEAGTKRKFDRYAIRGEWFFQSISVALSGITEIFDEVGYARTVAAPKTKADREELRGGWDRRRPFDKRALQLSDEYSAALGVASEATERAAMLTAIAEWARMKHERKGVVSIDMVKRAERDAAKAVSALIPCLSDRNLDLKSARAFLQLSCGVTLTQFQS